jgi:hypothetical protein
MNNGSGVNDLLEPYDAKVSRTVLMGGEGGNASSPYQTGRAAAADAGRLAAHLRGTFFT